MKEIPKEIIELAKKEYPEIGDEYFSIRRKAFLDGYQLADCEYWKKENERLRGLIEKSYYSGVCFEETNHKLLPTDHDQAMKTDLEQFKTENNL